MDRLKLKISALRTQVTKLISEAELFLASNAKDGALNVLSAGLSAIQIQLNEVDTAIESLVVDEDSEQNYIRTFEYNDQIITCIAKRSQEAKEQKNKKTSRIGRDAGTNRRPSEGCTDPR